MSGTNRLVQSKNAIEGSDEETLREALWNADQKAKDILEEGLPLKAAKK